MLKNSKENANRLVVPGLWCKSRQTTGLTLSNIAKICIASQFHGADMMKGLVRGSTTQGVAPPRSLDVLSCMHGLGE